MGFFDNLKSRLLEHKVAIEMREFCSDNLISPELKNAALIATNHYFGHTEGGTVEDYKAFMAAGVSGSQYELQQMIDRIREKYPNVDLVWDQFSSYIHS
jgi:hypothetical protein